MTRTDAGTTAPGSAGSGTTEPGSPGSGTTTPGAAGSGTVEPGSTGSGTAATGARRPVVGGVLAVLRSRWVRWGFLAVALGLAVWYVLGNREALARAATDLSGTEVVLVVVLGVLYVWCTLLAWRVVLADLGSPLSLRSAVAVFGVSQLGKYVPGGVWNVVAAAEVGAGHGVPRSRSAASMLVAVAVSVASGAAVGAVALPFVSAGALGAWSWVVWAAPAVVLVLAPPVLNRLIGTAVRLTGRAAPERPMTWGGLARAAAWSVAGWLVAGLQLWVLCTGLGLPLTVRTFALAAGGWALAWTAGFLFVVAPAGAGVRELVLAAVLAGALPAPAAALAVLVSRVVLTLVDLAFAGAGLLNRKQG
ncbi:lysylphosphatidylglycerol synthase domain-containing protein [Promicromonospora sp. NPDC060271]|uniref:lysylphosphatidylglycerol synthase domain-containing protein n=1 Tax=Promicromonospora sp. NPDC060271 TaxID=3347089 RepID=UPI003649FE77